MKFNLQNLRWPYREDLVFSILSFIVFIVPLALAVFTNENFETIKLALWLVLLGWALLVWAWRGYKQKSPGARLALAPLIAWLLLGLAAWAALSALLAPDKLYGFFGFYYRFTNSFIFILLWSATVILLGGSLDRRRFSLLLKILFFDAVLISLKSILEAAGLTLYLGQGSEVFFRAAPSLLGNPNYSSMFVACLLPLGAVFWRESNQRWPKIYYSVGIVVILFSLAALASRGAWAGLLAGCLAALVLLPFGRISKKVWLKAAAAAVTALVLGGILVKVSRPEIFHWKKGDDNVELRLGVWQQSLEAVKKQPLVGVGLGNFALFHERQGRPAGMGVFDDPHNLWVLLAVSGGIPLLLLFASVMTAAFISGLRLWRQASDLLAFAVLCALVVFLVAASFTPVPTPCFLLLAVFLAGLPALGRQSKGLRVDRTLVVAAAAGGVIFAVWGLALGIGETALHFGYNNFVAGNFQRAAGWLNLSRTVNPTNQLARVYYIQSQIRLKSDPALLERKIQNMVDLHPRQANIYVLASDNYAALFHSLKDVRYLDMAMANLEKSLAIDPLFPERYGKLGFYYYLKQDYPAALDYSQRALALEPRLVPSIIVQAKIYQLQGNRELLMQALERAYNINPEEPRLKYLWLFARQEKDIQKIPLNIIYAN